jgi:hypothetical protein
VNMVFSMVFVVLGVFGQQFANNNSPVRRHLRTGTLLWYKSKNFLSTNLPLFVEFAIFNAVKRSNNIPYLPFDLPARILNSTAKRKENIQHDFEF